MECALKACIALQTKRHDFPNKRFVNEAYTHNLERLIKLAGLETHLEEEMAKNAVFAVNWALVKDWNEQSRYKTSVSVKDAKDLYSACTSRKHGILAWIRERW